MSDTELSPIKKALLEQRRLKARIQELERELAAPRAEPVAVIGLGCRFPGASGPEAFWQLLQNGVDAISDLPPDRWDVSSIYDADPEAPGKFATRFGGYLTDVDQWDARRFGISPREATTMDPQQRILLEVTWEALEDAGLAPDSLTGAQTGVFVGIGPNDYMQRYAQRGRVDEIDAYLATGNAHSVASGRVSYLLGLHGPAISVDTACSSSLVAVQLACDSIRNGTCEAAVAGGVGILLGEQNYISLSKARMMAPDGRCKAFDSRANGFVRAEGCGIVVLKKLSAAERDGDRVLAVIRGGAINQDGRSNGITAPNGPSQQAVIRAAHANAGTSPSSVTYIEAHGTGTSLGDPIEVDSLSAVLGENGARTTPLYLGSVKTNIGHTEAAAGVAGLIKTVLALHHREIPPNLHFQAPNPFIAWDEAPYLRVPTTRVPWQSAGVRTAGVSAFGFSGTNVHLVLEEAPATAPNERGAERPLHVMALSAKSDAALRIAANDLAKMLAASNADIGDVAYSVNTGRSSLEERIALVGDTRDDLRSQLVQLASGARAVRGRSVTTISGSAPRVLFVIPEVGTDVLWSAQTLYATQPAFRLAIDACAAAPPESARQTVLDVLQGNRAVAFESVPAETRAVIHFAVSYALAAMWMSWGVRADAVLGESIGELVSLVVAGTVTLDEAVSLVAHVPSAGGSPRVAPQIPVFSSGKGRRLTVDEALSASSNGSAPRGASGRTAAQEAATRDGYTAVVDLSVLEWSALTGALADLFGQGVAVDWRGFDRGYGRTRVGVPASPWMRERYWFDEVEPAQRGGASAAAKALTTTSAIDALPTAPIADESLRDRLTAVTLSERTDMLRELVQRQVIRVMRLRPNAPPPSANDRLMSIGMDSLMAVELRKSLTKELENAVDLPSTLIFDYPTIGDIVALILKSLGLGADRTAPASVEPETSAVNEAVAALAGLSDEDVEAMLLEQLKGFK